MGVKLGSSWWLYCPTAEDEAFRLECPYPEENFTLNNAVLATLFTNTATGGFNNAITDTASLGTKTYGSFVRNPPPDISIQTYYAIIEEPEVIL